MDANKIQSLFWIVWVIGFCVGIGVGIKIGAYLQRREQKKLNEEN
jgi:uncharacterized protein YneF (UPF0154 family)